MANKISTKQAKKQLEKILNKLEAWQNRNPDNINLQQIQAEVNAPKSQLMSILKKLEEGLGTEESEIKDKQTAGYVNQDGN
jgi:hypothetical protein